MLSAVTVHDTGTFLDSNAVSGNSSRYRHISRASALRNHMVISTGLCDTNKQKRYRINVGTSLSHSSLRLPFSRSVHFFAPPSFSRARAHTHTHTHTHTLTHTHTHTPHSLTRTRTHAHTHGHARTHAQTDGVEWGRSSPAVQPILSPRGNLTYRAPPSPLTISPSPPPPHTPPHRPVRVSAPLEGSLAESAYFILNLKKVTV